MQLPVGGLDRKCGHAERMVLSLEVICEIRRREHAAPQDHKRQLSFTVGQRCACKKVDVDEDIIARLSDYRAKKRCYRYKLMPAEDAVAVVRPENDRGAAA